MGYDIKFHQSGTIIFTTDAITYTQPADEEMSITYRYHQVFRRVDVFGEQGICLLDFKTGQQAIPLLQHALEVLGEPETGEENASKYLRLVLMKAQALPHHVIHVT
ncbi:MAG: hypothetical protein H0V70_30310 [Ktedonobacteraceae bacterium]|nr:hypothetical protein [Ktedonobacteraceae bacterium]